MESLSRVQNVSTKRRDRIDCPVHDQPDVAAADQHVKERFTWEAGQTVICLRYNGGWKAACAEYARIFAESGN